MWQMELGVYDAILGMDWLEHHNPQIDWVGKSMVIPSEKGHIHLQGNSTSTLSENLLSALQFTSMCRTGAVSHVVQLYMVSDTKEPSAAIPSVVQHVLDQFEDVFAEPQGLPPRRACDHRIPLIPGACPVNIRPYRHKPELKTEINKQVNELLASGVI